MTKKIDELKTQIKTEQKAKSNAEKLNDIAHKCLLILEKNKLIWAKKHATK